MLSENMSRAMNVQVNREFYSSYLYLSMSAFFESLGLKGMASWMRVQAGEELVHAMKMYDYIVCEGGRANMLAVESPKFSWSSPEEAFQQVWDHERAVTGLIRNLMNVAIMDNDDSAKRFLQWYVNEQVEEEESSDNVLKNVKAAGNDPHALKNVDRELGQRRFRFPRGYGIFPNVAQQDVTIGSLKK
jgi:ferritin